MQRLGYNLLQSRRDWFFFMAAGAHKCEFQVLARFRCLLFVIINKKKIDDELSSLLSIGPKRYMYTFVAVIDYFGHPRAGINN